MKSTTKTQFTRYFKAYLAEPKEENTTLSHVKVLFSKKPFSPEQFTSLVMGVMEAYAQELLTTNTPEQIYEHFNNAFGIFLTKLVPQDYIFSHSEEHKKFKEHIDATLGQPEDTKDTENNRMAAYLLARDILTNEAGFTPETADLLLNRRLGLIAPKERNDGEETTES